jgi:hypothetical protein
LALREEYKGCNKVVEQISGVSSHKKNEKIPIRKTFFRYSAHVRLIQFLRFLSVWTLKAPVYSVQIENEETFHQRVLRPDRPFGDAPGPMKVCDSPGSDVSMFELTLWRRNFLLNFNTPCV